MLASNLISPPKSPELKDLLIRSNKGQGRWGILVMLIAIVFLLIASLFVTIPETILTTVQIKSPPELAIISSARSGNLELFKHENDTVCAGDIIAYIRNRDDFQAIERLEIFLQEGKPYRLKGLDNISWPVEIQDNLANLTSSLQKLNEFSEQRVFLDQLFALNNQVDVQNRFGPEIKKMKRKRKILESILTTNAENERKKVINNVAKWKNSYKVTSTTNGIVSFFRDRDDERLILCGDTICVIAPKILSVSGTTEISLLDGAKLKRGDDVSISALDRPLNEQGRIAGCIESMIWEQNKNSYHLRIVMELNVDDKTVKRTILGGKLGIKTRIVTRGNRLYDKLFGNATKPFQNQM